MSDEEIHRWTSTKSEETLRNPWFGVIKHCVMLPGGDTIDFHMVDFPRPSVGIVVENRGEILLLRQYRITIDSFVWAIPSGGVEEGETPQKAAKRELMEETGLKTNSLLPIISYNPSYGATNQRFHTFLARDTICTNIRLEGDEVIYSRWFPRSEVERMVFNGEIVDGLSLVPLLMLFLRPNI